MGADEAVVKLQSCRGRIDLLDGRILELLNERAAIALEIGGAKREAGLPVVEWSGADVSAWCGEFFDLVSETEVDDTGTVIAGLAHLPSPHLDVAAGNAVTKPSGLRFVWDLAKSPVDVHTLLGATGAVGLLMRKPPPPPPAKARRARAKPPAMDAVGF